MTRVSLVELRKNPLKIIHRVQAGETLILTHRGAPVLRLVPMTEAENRETDAFYRLSELAEKGVSLGNRAMDEAIYRG